MVEKTVWTSRKRRYLRKKLWGTSFLDSLCTVSTVLEFRRLFCYYDTGRTLADTI